MWLEYTWLIAIKCTAYSPQSCWLFGALFCSSWHGVYVYLHCLAGHCAPD